MIKPLEFSGFTFTKEANYAALEAKLLAVPKWTIHDLGLCSDGVNKVYGFSLGNLTTKNVIYIESSIHGGHEWRCAHWAIEWMKILANPNNYAQRQGIEDLTRDFSFYIIPCLNPYGYENTSYVNANGVNINRNFDINWEAYPTTVPFDDQYKGTAPFSEPETAIIRDIVDLYKPLVFVDNHTWGGYTGANLEIKFRIRNYQVLLEGVANSLKLLNAGVRANIASVAGTVPVAVEWASRKISKRGYPCIAVTFEPGSNDSSTEQSRLGINAMFLISLYVKRWINENKQNFN